MRCYGNGIKKTNDRMTVSYEAYSVYIHCWTLLIDKLNYESVKSVFIRVHFLKQINTNVVTVAECHILHIVKQIYLVVRKT